MSGSRGLYLPVIIVMAILVDWSAEGPLTRLVLGTSTLRVNTVPDGASVFLDAELIGTTPLRHELRPGNTVLKLEHPFHPNHVERLELLRGKTKMLGIALEPAFGNLEIITNPKAAQVILNGEELDGRTPIKLRDLPTGIHDVGVFIYGREPITETITVTPNANISRTYELVREPMGSLTIDTVPTNAAVRLVEVKQPYEPQMLLPIGSYEIEVSHPGYTPQSLRMVVRQQANTRRIRLEREYGRLNLSIAPGEAVVTIRYDAGSGVRSFEYFDRMQVPTGNVVIRAKALGYRNYERNLKMSMAGLNHNIDMKKFQITPGREFRDELRGGGDGPLLKILSAGSFVMGAAGGYPDERPPRTVTVTQPFAIGVYELTRRQYNRVESLGPEDNVPATNLSWGQVDGYLGWLSRETSYTYRLPSEAEWEYAARAGTTTPYYFGSDPGRLCEYENVGDQAMRTQFQKDTVASCNDGVIRLAPVGNFKPNPFGLFDMLGNVHEWVADCWHRNHEGAPSTAKARTSICNTPGHVVRGGDWFAAPADARVSFRNVGTKASDSLGFRVVREL